MSGLMFTYKYTGPASQGILIKNKGDNAVQNTKMGMPQKFGSASSYGKKYALGNLFLIDDTQDSDASNSHGKTTATKKFS